MPKLTSKAVQEVVNSTLFDPAKDDGMPIYVKAIVSEYGFHPDRLADNRPAISDMLAELPVEFQKEPAGGGGWTFLNACVDRHGEQWIGLHSIMEQLFAMGEAAGLVRPLMPREFWELMPGGMPYYVVDLDGQLKP